MIDWDDTRKVMSEPFKIQTHQRTFTNYLEVLLDEDGNVHYAVPSHQEWLIQKACIKLNVEDRESLMGLVPREYYFDMIGWLTKVTDCIAVWDTEYIGKLNRKQKSQLELLQLSDLYKGEI